MPRSSNEGKAQIKDWVEKVNIKHKKIVDVATGQGTYKDMFGDFEVFKDCVWHGIEIWPRWIRKYNLKEKYNYLYEADVRTFDYASKGPFDVAFVGDVLEHMTKEESIALVDKLLLSVDTMFVSIPIVYMPQGADGGNPYEVHVKPDWSHTEVLETFPYIKESWAGKKIGVYKISKT